MTDKRSWAGAFRQVMTQHVALVQALVNKGILTPQDLEQATSYAVHVVDQEWAAESERRKNE